MIPIAPSVGFFTAFFFMFGISVIAAGSVIVAYASPPISKPLTSNSSCENWVLSSSNQTYQKCFASEIDTLGSQCTTPCVCYNKEQSASCLGYPSIPSLIALGGTAIGLGIMVLIGVSIWVILRSKHSQSFNLQSK
jgi:hypothetical protein